MARRMRSLSGPLGNSLARQREARDAQQDQSESEQRREFLHASSEFEDFVSEFQLGQVRHVQTDRYGRRCAEPPSRRRPRNADISRDGQVPSALHELAQTVVVALLRAGRGHDMIIGPRIAAAVKRSRCGKTATRAQTCRMSVNTARAVS